MMMFLFLHVFAVDVCKNFTTEIVIQTQLQKSFAEVNRNLGVIFDLKHLKSVFWQVFLHGKNFNQEVKKALDLMDSINNKENSELYSYLVHLSHNSESIMDTDDLLSFSIYGDYPEMGQDVRLFTMLEGLEKRTRINMDSFIKNEFSTDLAYDNFKYRVELDKEKEFPLYDQDRKVLWSVLIKALLYEKNPYRSTQMQQLVLSEKVNRNDKDVQKLVSLFNTLLMFEEYASLNN